MEHGLPPGVFAHGKHVMASTIQMNQLWGEGQSDEDRRARHGLVVMGVFGDWVHVSFDDFKDALVYNQGKSAALQIGDGWICPAEKWSADDQVIVWFCPK